MPHELATTADGRTAMMYCGESPWHGLGTRLDAPATAAEAITAAGLDYDVTLTPMTTTDGLPVPQRRAVVRADTRAVLGVVSDRYVPVQNRQAFGFLVVLPRHSCKQFLHESSSFRTAVQAVIRAGRSQSSRSRR